MLIRLSFLQAYAVDICSVRALVLASLMLATSGAVRAGVDAPSSEAVWGCLLYASNDRSADKDDAQIPTRIRSYDERLEKSLGYASIRTLGQGQTRIEPNNSGSIVFHGNIRIELIGLTRQPRDRFLVGLRVFHGEHQLIETQAEVTRGSPLFIRGPLWREGQLVVAVMVIS
jgi:hypothetical protein